MSDKEFIGKISISAMKCVPARAKTENKPIALAHVMGIATGLKPKKGNNDEITMAIVGNFEGHNLETGEVFNSAVLYLPAGIQEAVESQLSGTNPSPIEFAIEISSVPSKNPAGYSYSVKQLYKPEVADPLEKMRQHVTAHKQAVLEAPKETAVTGSKK